MNVNVMKLDNEAIIPQYSKFGDAGLDLTCVSKEYDNSGNISYGTGLAIEIPYGYVGLLFPRSSVSKTQQILTNCVGVIDSGYRGEIILKFKSIEGGHSRNLSIIEDSYEVGDRVGQLIILPYTPIDLIEIQELSDSIRGTNNFGSTGK